jgi:cytoplasmic tRNA 2-thiolation protein 2
MDRVHCVSGKSGFVILPLDDVLLPFSSVQSGIRDWKARISIRSLAEPHIASPLSDIQADKPKNSLSSLRHQSPSHSQNLAPYLCYACHTTLSSRSSRGIKSRHKFPTDGQCNSSGVADAAALPVWVESRIVGSLTHNENVSDGADDQNGKNNAHGGKSLGGAGMEKIIAEFLLDDEGH